MAFDWLQDVRQGWLRGNPIRRMARQASSGSSLAHVQMLESRQLLSASPVSRDFQFDQSDTNDAGPGFASPLSDTAIPTVTSVTASGLPIAEGQIFLDPPVDITVAFSQEMATTGPGSVADPANWMLLRDGYEVPDGVAIVSTSTDRDGFTLSELSLSNGLLGNGHYQLIAKDTITDAMGTPLDGDTDNSAGGDFLLDFVLRQSQPVVGETLVNTQTDGYQDNSSVAFDDNGNSIVVWYSSYDFNIHAQRYDFAGAKVGNEFVINSNTTSNPASYNPEVAMDAVGDFVVTWQSEYFDSGSGSIEREILARRFDAAGAAQGAEFQVNAVTTGSQVSPTLAMDADGDFVIAWLDSDQAGVFAQRYNSAGQAQGGNFAVHDNSFFGVDPAVAMDADGDFVVTFSDVMGNDGFGYGIYAQRYDANGMAQGTPFLVNSYTDNNQITSDVAMDAAGNFVVTWVSDGQDGDGYGIYAQRFDASGAMVDTEFRVNTTTSSVQKTPAIAMDDTGDFVIAWDSYYQDGDVHGVYAQRYDSQGQTQGPEFLVNTTTTSNQFTPAVGMDADGDFLVSWSSANQDGDGYGIYSQLYLGNLPPVILPGQTLTVAENAADGSSVGTPVATDDDIGDVLTYSFSGGNVHQAFSIDASTGEISVAKGKLLDFEGLNHYDLRVAVTDRFNVTRKATVGVDLTNVNEQPGVVPQQFSVPENSPAGTVVGTVAVSDIDANDSFTFAITGGNVRKAFAINELTGQITVAKSNLLDHESMPLFQVTVQVTDAGGLSRKAVMTINVDDVNEQPIVVSQQFSVTEFSPNGTTVGTVSASDPDGMDVLSYAITGGNVSHAFAIDSATGVLTVNNSTALDSFTRPTFQLSVQVTDSGGLSRKAVMTITVDPVPGFTADLNDADTLFGDFPTLMSFAL